MARLVEAWNREAPYVQGEVLVKFKSGALGVAESRAMSVVRGRADVPAARWVGDAILLPTPDEPDARMAAVRLAEQPEVEWAQPNYLRPLHATPNIRRIRGNGISTSSTCHGRGTSTRAARPMSPSQSSTPA